MPVPSNYESAGDFPREVGVLQSRTIAIISGKGGNGKTMIAAVMAEICDMFSRVALIDADTGTGGLSYYLGLKLARNVAVGLADLALDPKELAATDEISQMLQPLRKPFEHTVFLSVGNHRRLTEDVTTGRIPNVISYVLEFLRQKSYQWVFVDCRGGIDADSIGVCQSVDDIILIVEPDITSFQATQHVVEVLTARGLGRKLVGFIINKVFEDPATIVRNGTAVFKCQCLAAVPFDLDATRDFLIGNVPGSRTQFGIQLWSGLEKAYPGAIPDPPGRVWDYAEFSQVSLVNIEGSRGGVVCAAFILLLTMAYFLQWSGRLASITAEKQHLLDSLYFFMCAIIGIIGCIERLRRAVGRAMGVYIRMFSRLAGGKDKQYR